MICKMKLTVGNVLQNQRKDTTIKVLLEERQELLSKEGNENKSTGINLRNTQKYNTNDVTDTVGNHYRIICHIYINLLHVCRNYGEILQLEINFHNLI